ncbi:MAG: glycerophosphodiester phosphodiesterase family protein [Ignavibacteria bacterium]|nr:glycerophosphodiester phosphodiesterase family protein [Ignavibacteria bacterium]
MELIQHSQMLGATGVELNVRRTRDGYIIVFHDETFSPRTAQGLYLLGKVSNFDLEYIEKTNLSLVWLGVKEPECIDSVVAIQQDAILWAKFKNRDVIVLLGIPSKEILAPNIASKFAHTTPVLVELELETALNLPTCLDWAPRWTSNISAN